MTDLQPGPTRTPWRPMRGGEDLHAPVPILLVPGIDGSGIGHWQMHWAQTQPDAKIVQQDDWSKPDLGRWLDRLAGALHRKPGALVVGHSLGCILIAHAACLPMARDIGAALLVAPADVDRDGPGHERLRPFAPLPTKRLPFRSLLVASKDDPHMAFARAWSLARAWGSDFHDAGPCGHINVASGHGPWPAGLALLRKLEASCAPSANRQY